MYEDNEPTRPFGTAAREPEARPMKERVANTVDNARVTLANKMDSAAETMHARADNLPGVEKVSRLTHDAADRVGASAEYLRSHGTKDMIADLEAMVRSHPGKSILAGLFLGFLVGRAVRSD